MGKILTRPPWPVATRSVTGGRLHALTRPVTGQLRESAGGGQGDRPTLTHRQKRRMCIYCVSGHRAAHVHVQAACADACRCAPNCEVRFASRSGSSSRGIAHPSVLRESSHMVLLRWSHLKRTAHSAARPGMTPSRRVYWATSPSSSSCRARRTSPACSSPRM